MPTVWIISVFTEAYRPVGTQPPTHPSEKHMLAKISSSFAFWLLLEVEQWWVSGFRLRGSNYMGAQPAGWVLAVSGFRLWWPYCVGHQRRSSKWWVSGFRLRGPAWGLNPEGAQLWVPEKHIILYLLYHIYITILLNIGSYICILTFWLYLHIYIIISISAPLYHIWLARRNVSYHIHICISTCNIISYWSAFLDHPIISLHASHILSISIISMRILCRTGHVCKLASAIL